MTEYGGRPGSQPWHPQDPLYGEYGDQGWAAQQQQPGNDPYYQQQPAQPQPQYGDVHGHVHQDPYQQQAYGSDPYAGQGYGTGQGMTPQQQYGTDTGAWDTGTGQQAAMPYGAQPPHPDPYGGQGTDLYSTPEAYPPPQPPGQRRTEPAYDAEAYGQGDQGTAVSGQRSEALDDAEVIDVPRQEKQAFFDAPTTDERRRADRDDAYEDDDHDDEAPAKGRRGRGGRGGRAPAKKRKSRNGVACLFVATVLVGGLGGVGYFGYQFYQGRFGPAPDYTGTGIKDTAQVEIPPGSGGAAIGKILYDAGVVKSIEAFTDAQSKHKNGLNIQDGFYVLNKEMSGAAAVEAMLKEGSRSVLIVPEGKRNADIYKLIDEKLDLEDGTTAKVAKEKADKLGLPDWAKGHADVKDPLEGFLYPADYPAPKGGKPEDVLKSMVARANKEFAVHDMEAKAKSLGLKGPWELLTVASMVQVEGKYKHDFDKVSRVVYNRLKPDNTETVGRLEFDSTVNYLRGESTLDVGSVAEMRKIKDPYNTYNIKGLTPGPISNPGKDAVESAMNPAPGPWIYFVSINEDKTVFSETLAEHNKNVAEYEKERKRSGE